jgi:hypothetical protein
MATLGKATCSDGLTCIVTETQGQCVPFCNAANPCTSGYVCQAKTVELGPAPQPVISVCELEGPDGSILEVDGSNPPPPPDTDAGDSGSLEAGIVDGSTRLPDGGLPR